MEIIASPYRQCGSSRWTNDSEIEPEPRPPPPPRIQSRKSITVSKSSNSNHLTSIGGSLEAEAWPLPPQPPQEDHVSHRVEPWPLPPREMTRSNRFLNEDIDYFSSNHQIESPYVSQSPGTITPEEQLEIIESSTLFSDDDKRRTLTSLMEPLSVSPSTSSITMSQSDTCDESQSTTCDEEFYNPQLRNFVERTRISHDNGPPLPPPRMQSRAMSEIGLWQSHYRYEFDDGNSTASDWTTSTLPCKGKKSPEARPWLAPPFHRDFATEMDLSKIPFKAVEENPWLAPPHQGRLTPEGGACLPYPPPHQGRVTPVFQSVRPSSMHGDRSVDDECWIPRIDTCQCYDSVRADNRYQKSYVRCISSPPPLPQHKKQMISPMRQLSLPVVPPPPPHKGRMTPSLGTSTIPCIRAKHRFQDGVQIREKAPKDDALSASAKNIFRRCKSGILAHTRRSTEVMDPNIHKKRRSVQPVISQSEKSSLKTQSSENSSFHDQVKALASSVDLGECFIM